MLYCSTAKLSLECGFFTEDVTRNCSFLARNWPGSRISVWFGLTPVLSSHGPRALGKERLQAFDLVYTTSKQIRTRFWKSPERPLTTWLARSKLHAGIYGPARTGSPSFLCRWQKHPGTPDLWSLSERGHGINSHV